MRYIELTEGKNTPVIIVDIQPAHLRKTHRVALNSAEFLAKQRGPILMFVNADETGMSDDNIEDDIIPYWEWIFAKLGLYNKFSDFMNRTTIVDKGYGYLRAWMDQGISPKAIIKTIRLMYKNRVNDSRLLFGGEDSEDYEVNMKALLGKEYKSFVLDDSLVVEWTSVAQLKQFSGAYIIGGGRNECLREVELLMNAFNIKYKEIDELIYG